MSIYKIPHGWKVDLRRHRVGEKLFRDTATFDTKTEAEAYLKRLKGRLEEAAKLGLCMPSSITLSEALDDWWRESKSKMAPSSWDAAHTRMKMWQASHLAHLRLTELTRKHLKGWIEDRRQQGRAASTIKNDLHILQAMFKYLKDDLDWHMDNPVDPLMRHVKIHNARHRRLSEDEYRRLLSSDVARELAFAPRSAVLELMARIGHTDLRSSSDIYSVLVSELGEDAACFSGAYDIPLQLVATNAAARREAEQWAEHGPFVENDEAAERERL